MSLVLIVVFFALDDQITGLWPLESDLSLSVLSCDNVATQAVGSARRGQQRVRKLSLVFGERLLVPNGRLGRWRESGNSQCDRSDGAIVDPVELSLIVLPVEESKRRKQNRGCFGNVEWSGESVGAVYRGGV